MNRILKILKTAIEGLEALEVARTKFFACEFERAREIERIMENLMSELIETTLKSRKLDFNRPMC